MNIDITHKHFDKSNDKKSGKFLQIKTLVRAKVSKLEEFIPEFARRSASAKVVVDEMHNKSKGYDFKTEIVVVLPDKKLIANAKGKTAEESVDKAQSRAARQIRKYKTKHSVKSRLSHRSKSIKGSFNQVEQKQLNTE